MLIVCPKCFTQYLISDEIKLGKSNKFHCTHCDKYFTQDIDLPQTFELTPPLQPAPKASIMPSHNTGESFFAPEIKKSTPTAPLGQIPDEFKPVVIEKKSIMGLILFYLVVLLCLLGMMHYHKNEIAKKLDVIIIDIFDYQKPGSVVLPKIHTQAPKIAPDKAIAKPATPATKTPATSATPAPASKPTPPATASAKNSNVDIFTAMVDKNIATVNSQFAPITPETIKPVEQIAPVEKAEPAPIIAPVKKEESAPKTKGTSTTKTDAINTPKNESASIEIAPVVNPLKIDDISYALYPMQNNMHKLEVKGLIVNTDLPNMPTPKLRAIVYDDQGLIVARKQIVPNKANIKGNSTLPFATAITPVPGNIIRVEVIFDEI